MRKQRKRKKVAGLSEERRRKSPGDRDATVAILNLTKVMLTRGDGDDSIENSI